GMSYAIDGGGEGRFKSGDDEDVFPVSHEEYVRIRALLDPYREKGLLCDDPDQTRWNTGHILWRENGVETRRPYETPCYTDTYRAASRGVSEVYYAMRDMAEERRVPPPALPSPDRLTLTSLYWGRVTQEWSMPRGGEGRWSEGDSASKTFPVSEADFDRL